MTRSYSEQAGRLQQTPPQPVDSGNWDARLRRFRATVRCTGQKKGDEVVLVRIPLMLIFAFGLIGGDVGEARLSIGTDDDPTLYMAGAKPNGPFTSAAAAEEKGTEHLSQEVILTVASGSLPKDGKMVVDLYFSGA